MFSFHRRHFIGFDTCKALVVMLAIVLIQEVFDFNLHINLASTGRDFGDLYIALASIYAGLLGFIITAGAVIFSIDTGKRIEMLRKSPYFSQIFSSYISASLWLLVGALIMLGLFAYTDPQAPTTLTSYALLATVLLNVLKCWRAVSLLKKVYTLSSKNHGD